MGVATQSEDTSVLEDNDVQIGGIASPASVDARVRKAIELTHPERGASSGQVEKGSAKSAAGRTDAANAASSFGGAPRTDWARVSQNLAEVSGNVFYTSDLSRVADLAIKDASAKLDVAFREHGISRDPPVTFSLSLNDGSLVVDQHPQKDAIEALFAGDPALRDDVREAFVLKEQAVSSERGALFAEAYQRAHARGGQSAADQVTRLFAGLDQKSPTFRFGDDGASVMYDGQTDRDYMASVARHLNLTGMLNVSV